MKKFTIPAGEYTTPTLYAKARNMTRSGVHERIRRGELTTVRIGNQVLIQLSAVGN